MRIKSGVNKLKMQVSCLSEILSKNIYLRQRGLIILYTLDRSTSVALRFFFKRIIHNLI